jgi:hypothetical protein
MPSLAEIGGNFPPSPIEALRLQLAEDASRLFARRDELLASAARAPEVVSDDETAGKVGDLIKLLTTAMKSAETARVGAKEPYLEAGRAVDGFYKTAILEPLERAKHIVQVRLAIFLKQKEAAARRAAEELAQREREEAERLAALAEATSSDATLAEAALAEERALEAAALAEAKAAELSRSRGDYGSVASLRTTWEAEITDRALLDLEALRPHFALADLEKAARAFTKAGGRELRGARIFEATAAVVR